MAMVSIIIPCYNAASTIRKSAKSVLSQTYTDVELILVDDGSKDNTREVCERLMSADSRVRYIHVPVNAGVDNARFTGLAAAKGEYIMFVDSDDWLSGKDTLQRMVDELVENDADYVEVGMTRVLDKMGLICGKGDIQAKQIIENPRLFDEFYISFFGVNKLSVSMCAKLYRHSVIKQAEIKPSGLRMGEDLHFNLMLFPHLRRIVRLDMAPYNYQFGGVTSGYNASLFDNMLKLYNIKKGLIEKYRYDKATDFIIIELVNVLRSEICQNLRFSKSPEATKARIAELLSLDVWDDIANVSQHDEWLTRPFSKAVRAKDAEQIYAMCAEIEKKNRIPFLMKKYISKILAFV